MNTKTLSRLTGSELQGQEEAACARPADATTGVLFTVTKAMKFPCTVTQSSWALPLSYYRASTFLPSRMNKPKINEHGAPLLRTSHFDFYGTCFPI